MSDGPGIERIGQLAIPVADLERAVAFYSDVLGLRLLFRAPPGLAFFDCGGVRLMPSRPEGADAPPRAGLLYYLVPDVRAARATLVARGVAFVQPPIPSPGFPTMSSGWRSAATRRTTSWRS
jgi:methylmalonyl-CoA/ethylmalonyl-CoA epimerase